MRAFMAVETSKEVGILVSNFQKVLKEKGFYGSWPSRSNVHMTLFFFGEIDENNVKKISILMDKEAEKIESFQIVIDKIGFFPPHGLPRVVWLGTKRSAETERLYVRLNSDLKKMGFDFSKKFTPHVTVGRVKGVPKGWKEKAMSFEFKPVEFECTSITLFSSKLTPRGAVYDVIHRSKLGG